MSAVRKLAGRAALLGVLASAAGCGLDQAGVGRPMSPDAPGEDDDAVPTSVMRDGSVSASPSSDAGDKGASDGASAEAATGASDAGVAPGCNFVGAFGMRIEFDVTWERTSFNVGIGLPRPLLAGGSDVLTVYTSAEVRQEGDSFRATLRPCGADVPDFKSALGNEHYGVYVSDFAWESAQMPRWTVDWQPACLASGCVMQSSPFEGWIGAAPAPETTRDEVVPVDVDSDGKPGLTLLTRQPGEFSPFGEPYAQPPLEVGLRYGRVASRARELMLAIAMRAHFSGQIEDCDNIAGESSEGDVRGIAFGCTSEAGDVTLAACGSRLVRAVDANLPEWKVHAARYRTVRMPDARCAAVRDLFKGP